MIVLANDMRMHACTDHCNELHVLSLLHHYKNLHCLASSLFSRILFFKARPTAELKSFQRHSILYCTDDNVHHPDMADAEVSGHISGANAHRHI